MKPHDIAKLNARVEAALHGEHDAEACLECRYDLKWRGLRIHHPPPNYLADPVPLDDVWAWLEKEADRAGSFLTIIYNGRGYTARACDEEACGESRAEALCRLALKLARKEEPSPEEGASRR